MIRDHGRLIVYQRQDGLAETVCHRGREQGLVAGRHERCQSGSCRRELGNGSYRTVIRCILPGRSGQALLTTVA